MPSDKYVNRMEFKHFSMSFILFLKPSRHKLILDLTIFYLLQHSKEH